MVLSSLWNECHLSYSLYMLDSVTEIALGPKEGALRNSADSTEGGGEAEHSLWRLCWSNSAPEIPSGNSMAAVTPLSGAQQILGYKISLYFSSQWSLCCAERRTIFAAVACHILKSGPQSTVNIHAAFPNHKPFFVGQLKKSKRRAVRIVDL